MAPPREYTSTHTRCARKDSLDWNDLQYVLEVKRTGSAAAAGRSLGVSHATVFRRIEILEKQLRALIFRRSHSGLVPTDLCMRLCEVGPIVEQAIVDAQRFADGQVAELTGKLRFTTTDSIAHNLVGPLLASFRSQFPAIEVDVLVTNKLIDLDRQDADIALRPSSHPPEAWVGMRLARMGFAIYASHEYLEAHSQSPWTALHWIMPGGELLASTMGSWLQSQLDAPTIVASIDTFVGLAKLAAEGMGAALLPRFVGASDSRLKEVTRVPDAACVDLWILTHADSRGSARIKAFMTHVAAALRDNPHFQHEA